MFKKVGYFLCVLGLFLSAPMYANAVKVIVNDGGPIHKLVFSGGAYFYRASSYPVTHVTTDNVTAITPFSDKIASQATIAATYDIATVGEKASIFTWFDRNATTGNGVEVGMYIDSTGSLAGTLCESDSKAPLYLVVCDVTVMNGVANMNLFLTDKK